MMGRGYQIIPVAGKYSWTVRHENGRETGIAPNRERAVAEIETACARLNLAPPVRVFIREYPDMRAVAKWAAQARATVAAVADRPETSKPAVADLSRAQRLLDNVLKELNQ